MKVATRTARRKSRSFVESIDKNNADEWYSVIKRCAETKSNDLATFPNFGHFLSALGR